MIYEYFLELNAYHYTRRNMPIGAGEEERCWGKDEYDTLTRHIERYLKKTKEDNIDIFFKLSRLRPTGRMQKYPYNIHLPYFETNVRPYIKGRITEFMVRFSAVDTKLELGRYRTRYEEFLKNYNSELNDEIRSNIEKQYNKRMKMIENGQIKPLSLDIRSSYSENQSASQSLKNYCSHVIKILRMFGFRVESIGGKFKLLKPVYYTNGISNIDLYETPIVLSPVEIISYWLRNYYKWTLEYDRKKFGLEEYYKNVISELGYTNSEKNCLDYCKSLKQQNITPFMYQDYDGDYNIAVLKQEEEQASNILSSINAKLRDYYSFTDPADFCTKTCAICGSSFTGDDNLCSNCANNID